MATSSLPASRPLKAHGPFISSQLVVSEVPAPLIAPWQSSTRVSSRTQSRTKLRSNRPAGLEDPAHPSCRRAEVSRDRRSHRGQRTGSQSQERGSKQKVSQRLSSPGQASRPAWSSASGRARPAEALPPPSWAQMAGTSPAVASAHSQLCLCLRSDPALCVQAVL